MTAINTNRLVSGVGTNDADYVTQKEEIINGKRIQVWICPYYRTWRSMLNRCYSNNYKSKRPSYIGCSVAEEWLKFSIFKEWMKSQSWEGNNLDKDLLIKGNKIYSPSTCIFVSPQINGFIVDNAASRGNLMIGVSLAYYKNRVNKFMAKCSNPFTKKEDHLGYFYTEKAAHEAWKNKKHQHALIYADMQTDQKIKDALRSRYA